MKILLVNKFYYPKGGADIHVLRLEEELRARGHEVAVFAMHDPKNNPTPWSKYFVSHVDFSKARFSLEGLRVIARMFWSFEAERKMRHLLRDFRPDVIHVHNIYHQLTPSIFRPMRQAGIPVVQTLHDYALISPNYSLFANGAICEDGKESSYWSLVRHRAIKGSVLASALDVAAYLFQGGAKPYIATVKQFISPSRFLARYVQGWIKQSVPITVLQNFTDQHHIEVPKQHRILYVGRLSHEKGVRVLLEAMKGIDVPLDIVGTGPEETSLRALAASLSLSNITWHGHQSQQTVQRLFAQSTVCVVPSTWYENNPLTILESFAQGTPVIGSDIGGIPELVTHDGTGAVIPPNDVAALHNILRDVQEHPERWNAMHVACRQTVSHNTPEQYIQEIEYIYEQALA